MKNFGENRYIALLIFLLVNSFILFSGCEENIHESNRFNLDFQLKDDVLYHWKASLLPPLETDPDTVINGKHPIICKSTPNRIVPVYYDPVYLSFCQTFLLPDKYEKECRVKITVNNRCYNMRDMQIDVVGIDRKNGIVFRDSLDINNENEWVESQREFLLTNSKYLSVIFSGNGTPDISQDSVSFVLDRMTIQINGKPIQQIRNINNLNQVAKKPLDEKYVCALTAQPEQVARQTGLKDKRIIGLGETVHGSATINAYSFELIKDLIVNHTCRMVLTEQSFLYSLKCNLFIKSLIPESAITDIEKSMSPDLIYWDALKDFLFWLRAYNADKESKVMFLGFENGYEFSSFSLPDPLSYFTTDEKEALFYPVIEKLNSYNPDDFEEAYQLLEQNAGTFREIVGAENFDLFFYGLGDLIERRKTTTFSRKALHTTFHRDAGMYKLVSYLIDTYLPKNATAVLYGHFEHIKKREKQTTLPLSTTLGYQLVQNYGDQYGVIGITVGKGEITIRKRRERDFVDSKLPGLIPSSLEYQLFHIIDNYFYYPSSQLPFSIYNLRCSGNRSILPDEDWGYTSVKDNSDGFIFIYNSQPFKHYYKEDPEYNFRKGADYRTQVEKMKNKQ